MRKLQPVKLSTVNLKVSSEQEKKMVLNPGPRHSKITTGEDRKVS